MNREILFRGKRVDNGEWVEGQLLYFKASVGKGVLALIVESAEWNNANEWFNLCKRAKVIPETVGQYTGLVDHNGKKIFEGDIVEFGDTLGVINFSIGCYCVRTNKPYWRTQDNPAIDVVFNEYPNEVKVIGNIHDNPDFLEVQ